LNQPAHQLRPAIDNLELIGELYAAEKDCASEDDRRRIREQHFRNIARRSPA
jgi:hypothetical protein